MHGQGDAGTVSDEDVLATGEGYVIAGCTSRGVNFNSFSASVFSGASQWYQRAQKAFDMHSTKLALSAAAASPASSSDKEDVTAACCYEQYALEQERLQQISDKMWNEQLRQLRLRQVQWRVESWLIARRGEGERTRQRCLGKCCGTALLILYGLWLLYRSSALQQEIE